MKKGLLILLASGAAFATLLAGCGEAAREVYIEVTSDGTSDLTSDLSGGTSEDSAESSVEESSVEENSVPTENSVPESSVPEREPVDPNEAESGLYDGNYAYYSDGLRMQFEGNGLALSGTRWSMDDPQLSLGGTCRIEGGKISLLYTVGENQWADEDLDLDGLPAGTTLEFYTGTIEKGRITLKNLRSGASNLLYCLPGYAPDAWYAGTYGLRSAGEPADATADAEKCLWIMGNEWVYDMGDSALGKAVAENGRLTLYLEDGSEMFAGTVEGETFTVTRYRGQALDAPMLYARD